MESILNPSFNKLPDELLMVIYAASVYTHQDAERLMHHLTRRAAAMDWENFILLADARHHVAVPVYKTFVQYGGCFVPCAAMDRLKQIDKIRRFRMMLMAGELVRVMKLFKENGVRALPLKGPALSLHLHDDPCMRFSTDLDIVVPKDQVEAADRVLAAAGYVRHMPAIELTIRQTRAFLSKGHHFGYCHASKNIRIELHWRLTGHEKLMPDLNFENAWQQRQFIRMGDMVMPILSPVHTVLYLSVHGAIHAWYRFIWLYDMGAVLHKYKNEVDWAGIAAQSADMGIQRMVTQGVRLAALTSNKEIPSSNFSRLAEKDKRIESLCRMSLKCLSNMNKAKDSGSIFKSEYYHSKFYGLFLLKAPAYKLQYLTDHFTTIGADWQDFSLPDRLFFLYHFLRPVLWATRRFQAYRIKFIKKEISSK